MNHARVLFVTNGHGEASIAARIAAELRSHANAATDHLALVGAGFTEAEFPEVGPRRVMPSGGLVAMGNVRAFGRDLAAGWLGLFGAQVRFLRAARRTYDGLVAIGDAYACALARGARRPLVFVGTAKSVYVAPYGALERNIIAGARRVFVRDAATAEDLVRHGVAAEAPGNVIVDLLATQERYAWQTPLRLALLPGSRESAYGHAALLAEVAAGVADRHAGVSAALSVAPGLEAERFAPIFACFPAVAPWHGPMGGILAGATLALGQAGTANEAAAANGVPVVALDLAGDRHGWYRMRQERLLGEAMLIVPGTVQAAAGAVAALLDEPTRLAAMGAVGRTRMGGPGGAAAIARAVAEMLAGAVAAA